MASRRMERVSRLLKQAISECVLNELSDPRMGFVTVTKVETASDLKTAKVFVSILGEEAECRRTMMGIGHAAGFIRRTVGRRIALKHVPVLHFVRDDSIKRSVRISRLIAEVLAEHRSEEEHDPK